MSGKSIVDQVKHYQKDIERSPENTERMIRCIQRLYVLPIKVEHLQETGVGRSVNSLRKYKGEVGDAAKALVAKWKAMVAAEESGDEVQTESKPKEREQKLSPPPPAQGIKVESKSEHHSNRDRSTTKIRHTSRSSSSSNNKHINNGKSHSSASRKRSHSNSNNSNSKNHKSLHHDRKMSSDDEASPSHHQKKRKNYLSSPKHHSSSKRHQAKSSESESESSDDNREANSQSDEESNNSENESRNGSDKDSSEDETHEITEENEQESDSSSSDDRHHSKHKSSYHKHKKSSHSSSERNKENKHHSHGKSENKSSSIGKSNNKDLKELIKENEKIIKKEKEDFITPKVVPNKKNNKKSVKLETNEDGSIDSGSGASFADALLVMDYGSDKKKKKKSPVSSHTPPSSSSPSKTIKSESHNDSNKKSGSHNNVINSKSSKSSSSSSSSSSKPSTKSRTIDELVETPDMLTKQVKLEALEIDISSTLPEINPNYKPLPHVPEHSRRHNKSMTDEDTMFSLMMNKNQRTKVFSGNKVYTNAVPSLFNLCIQLLYENIDAVEYTGGVPFNLLKALLERLNADQLYVIEHYNPYLIEDTDGLWKFHCSKDFRSEKRQDMESWRDLYLRCIEERERKLKALTANITQAMAKSTPVRQAKLAYVDTIVKPPRGVLRKQAKYGTSSSDSKSKNPSKQEVINKAIVGGHTPGVSVEDVVPTPSKIARIARVGASTNNASPAFMKKKKAPLMQKTLQFLKGNRYKR